MSVGVGQLGESHRDAAAAASTGHDDIKQQSTSSRNGNGSSTSATPPAAAPSPFHLIAAALAAAAAAIGAALRRVFAPKLSPGHINRLLGTNFSVMKFLGSRTLKPFLQDTIQLIPLSLTMWGMMMSNPPVVLRVLSQVGARVLGAWFVHYYALVVYTVAHAVLWPLRRVLGREGGGGYRLQR